jgi:acetyl esterase/lipase
LTELIVRLENDHGQGGGAGKAKIVLMGHSMGGLLIADTARDVVENTREGDPLWPKIVGIMGKSLESGSIIRMYGVNDGIYSF